MTNEELITKIKTEIDKLYGEYKDKFHQCGDQYHLGLIDGLDMAERVLDTLEKSEKPMNQDGLEEELINEADRKFFRMGFYEGDNHEPLLDCVSLEEFRGIARHFAEWGYLRAVEKYNEIEYNRQRAEEEMPLPEDTVLFNKGVAEGKRLMMEEAVEGEIQMRYSGCLCAKTIRAINEDKFKLGDKVRVIVCKKED